MLQVGTMEVVAVNIAIIGVAVALGTSLLIRREEGRVWRWMLAFLVCLAIGVLATPVDLASALIVAAPLFSAFMLGVYGSRFMVSPRRSQEG